jgi:hypothetical protein
MASVKTVYGTTAAVTCTITALAWSTSGTAGRESTAIDNSSNLYVDELVTVTAVVANAGTVGTDKGIYVYGYASFDAGSTYTRSGANSPTGTDAAYTFDDPTTLPMSYAPVGFIPTPTINQTYRKTFSVAAAFGGTLPPMWGLILRNYGGTSTSFTLTTGSGITHTPVYYSVT